MTEPDLTTEVVGYRQWYVTTDLELRAAGFGRGGTWERGENTAKCGRMKEAPISRSLHSSRLYIDDFSYEYVDDPCGDSPGEKCECGFYALHDPSDHWYGKDSGLMSVWHQANTDPLLSGIIVAWGKVQVHHQGFRAEHARIAALALPKTKRDQAVARAVASAYGVPCVPSEELPLIAAEYGGTVPVEYRPDKPEPTPVRGPGAYTTALSMGLATGGLFSQWTTWPTAYVPPALPPASGASKYIESIKKAANRQGPDKPKRAPRKLGGPR